MNGKKQNVEKPLNKIVEHDKKRSLSSLSTGSDLSCISSLNSISQEWILETNTPRESLKIEEDNDWNNKSSNNVNIHRQNSISDDGNNVAISGHHKTTSNLDKYSTTNNTTSKKKKNHKNSKNAKTKKDVEKKTITKKSGSSRSLSSTVSLFSESEKRNNSLLFFETHGIKANLANMSTSSIEDDDEKSDDCEIPDKNNENHKTHDRFNKIQNTLIPSNKTNSSHDVDVDEKNNQQNKRIAKDISTTKKKNAKADRMNHHKNDETKVNNKSENDNNMICHTTSFLTLDSLHSNNETTPTDDTVIIHSTSKSNKSFNNSNTPNKSNFKNIINRFQNKNENSNHKKKSNKKGKRKKQKKKK